jgi:hypothetical protein
MIAQLEHTQCSACELNALPCHALSIQLTYAQLTQCTAAAHAAHVCQSGIMTQHSTSRHLALHSSMAQSHSAHCSLLNTTTAQHCSPKVGRHQCRKYVAIDMGVAPIVVDPQAPPLLLQICFSRSTGCFPPQLQLPPHFPPVPTHLLLPAYCCNYQLPCCCPLGLLYICVPLAAFGPTSAAPLLQLPQ